MKTLLITNYDTWGGAARAALRLHKGLLGQGVVSQMAVRRKFSDTPGITVLAPGLVSRAGSILAGVRNRRELREFGAVDSARQGFMSHYRGRIKPDWKTLLAPYKVINLHWVPEMFDYQVFFDALEPHQRVVWTLHDMNAFSGACHYAGTCRKFLQSCGACPQVDSSNALDLSASGLGKKVEIFESLDERQLTVVTPSTWLGEMSRNSRILGRFPHRVIPYGLETDVFRPLDRAASRAKIGIEAHERVLLMLSATLHDRRKGMDLLQQALESTFSEQLVCLLTVGSGSVPDTGIKTIELGTLDDPEDVAAAYNAADLFVAPSREDNLPNTVLESLACGTPVVAFNIGGMPDMIDPGVTGLLARPEDSRDLGRCIAEMLAHEELSQSMRRQCRAVAEERYALERQAGDYIKLFNELSK